ncbi:MAG: hypothetical protein J5626_09890 [Lachnospiraceae bacterium]|nr:hypothetical protein [Lachnospiraceae bacterium]
MIKGVKAIQIFILTLAIALFMGGTTSYAFTVKDGENIVESPDGNRWIRSFGVFPDGKLLVVYFFDGTNSDNGLSVELSAADLKLPDNIFPYTGEIKYYVFVNNTSVFAELTQEDDVILLKDNTCVLTNTGTDISSDDIKGGDYIASEEPDDYLLYNYCIESGDVTGGLVMLYHKYRSIYDKMRLSYKNSSASSGVSEETPSQEEVEPISEPEEIPETPAEEEPPAPAPTPEPEPKPTPAPTPAPEPEPTPEPEPAPEEETVVKQEVEVTVPEPKEEPKLEVKEETSQSAKLTETPSLKRTEASIIGEELKYKVVAIIPAGVDERAVSKLQKQISETVDGLLSEITENPAAARERVSEQTYRNIERALSEGKTISAEVAMEKTEKESIPQNDLEALDSVTEDNKDSNLKIGRFFNISVMIKAGDGEELGTYDEVTEAILFTLPKPKDVPCPKGMEYVIIRIHEGEASILPVTVNADESISFETDRFSTYALAVREVIDEEVAKASDAVTGANSEKDEDIKDFAKWFLRILVFAFASGTVVILMGIRDKKKNK